MVGFSTQLLELVTLAKLTNLLPKGVKQLSRSQAQRTVATFSGCWTLQITYFTRCTQSKIKVLLKSSGDEVLSKKTRPEEAGPFMPKECLLAQNRKKRDRARLKIREN